MLVQGPPMILERNRIRVHLRFEVIWGSRSSEVRGRSFEDVQDSRWFKIYSHLRIAFIYPSLCLGEHMLPHTPPSTPTRCCGLGEVQFFRQRQQPSEDHFLREALQNILLSGSMKKDHAGCIWCQKSTSLRSSVEIATWHHYC